MSVRILITGDPDYSNEWAVSALLESEVRMARGQVVEIHDETSGELHEIVQELIVDHGDRGLISACNEGEYDEHIAFGRKDTPRSSAYTRI